MGDSTVLAIQQKKRWSAGWIYSLKYRPSCNIYRPGKWLPHIKNAIGSITRLLRTEALEKVVKNSRPNVEKVIVHAITELFEASELDIITMPLSAIAGEILKRRRIGTMLSVSWTKWATKRMRAAVEITHALLEVSEAGAGAGYSQKCIPVKFTACYYEFHRADFLGGTAPAAIPDQPQLPF